MVVVVVVVVLVVVLPVVLVVDSTSEDDIGLVDVTFLESEIMFPKVVSLLYSS